MDLSDLVPARIASKLEQFDTAFTLSRDDQRRRDAARRLATPSNWHRIVSSALVHLRWSYAQGEISRERALESVYQLSIGCWPQDRVRLLGWMAMYVFEQPAKPRAAGERGKDYPGWVKNLTADLILELKHRQPSVRVTPDTYNPSSLPIDRAVDMLKTLRVFGDKRSPAPTTVMGWTRERRNAQLSAKGVPVPKGRPRRSR